MHRSNRIPFLILGLLLVLAFAGTSVLAQTTELSGTVQDPQGAVVPGADVTLVDQGTQSQRSGITDDQGRFRFLQLRPGTYGLRIEMPGFKTLEQNDIRLLVDTPLSLDLKLELGQVSEIITVASSSQRLKNEIDGSIGNAFNTEQIVELPLNQRNVYQLLSVQPGVTQTGYVSGARSDQQNLTLDGIDVNEQQTGATYGTETDADVAFKSVLRVTPDSVQEFRVTTSSPTAAQGRSSGAQVSLVTKSGTNEFHGGLYAYHRNTVTAANDFFNNRVGIDRPALIRNLYGGSIGGPIKKERAFFFFNYEARKDRKEATQLNTVPLAHLGEGKMLYRDSAHNLVELGPDEILQLFPDVGGVNPLAAAALGAAASSYPATPGETGTGDQLNTGGYRFNAPIPLDWNTFTTRVDLVASDTQSIFLRGNYQWDHTTLSKYWPDTQAQELWSHPYGFAVGHTWNIRPTLINTFRYGLTREALTQLGDSSQNGITFRFVFQPNGLNNTVARTTPVHNITNDTSWVRGDHTFQFGTNIRLVKNGRESYGNAYDFATMNPSYYASSGSAMDVLTDYEDGLVDPIRTAFTSLVGRYTQYNATGTYNLQGVLEPSGTPTYRNFTSNEYELYFDDTWQVSPNLTVNLGVRWGVSTPVSETNGFEVAPTISLSEYFDRRVAGMNAGVPYTADLGVDLAGSKYGRPGMYKTDWNNFSPRVSFAYSPSVEDGFLHKLFGNKGDSVIRGGFSMMYDRVGSALAVNWDLNSTLGFVLSDTISANTFNATSRPGPLFTGFDQSIRDLPMMDVLDTISFPLSQAPDYDRRIESSLDAGITTPVNYNWNLTFGRELPGGIYLEASYIGRKARDLLAQRDIMMPNDIVDPQSGVDWYTAAAALYEHRANNTPIDQVPTIPFFENFFPTATDLWDPALTATQNIFAFVSHDGYDIPDWTYLQDYLDYYYNPGIFYQPQYGALVTWSTLAHSDYHGLALTVRERFKDSLSFDFNYTWSKSMDNASGLQSATNYDSGALILNAFRPEDSYSVSDFDTRHIVNANWLWTLPFGKGQAFGADMPGVAEALFGGWSLNGIFRWNSGLPMANPFEGSRWSTNWNVQSWASRIRDPHADPNKSGDTPNFWADPQYSYNSYRDTRAGDIGDRNVLSLDGYISLDFGLHKKFNMPYNEDHSITFRWEVFNVTNTQRLGAPTQTRDGWATSPDPQLGTPAPAFGNINVIQGAPRVMQFGLRYDF